jgi:hypothetical protein
MTRLLSLIESCESTLIVIHLYCSPNIFPQHTWAVSHVAHRGEIISLFQKDLHTFTLKAKVIRKKNSAKKKSNTTLRPHIIGKKLHDIKLKELFT